MDESLSTTEPTNNEEQPSTSTNNEEQPSTSTASATEIEGESDNHQTSEEQPSTSTSSDAVMDQEEPSPNGLPSTSAFHARWINPLNPPAEDSSEGEEIPEGFEWIEKLPQHMRDETKRILKHGMTDAERQAIYEKYPIPDNLRKLLLPPKVNPEIWALMPPEAKYHDLSMCHIHKGLAHTVVALGEALNSCTPRLKESMDKDKLESAVSAVSNLVINSSEGYANLGTTVTEGRRDMIMQFLSSEAQEEAKFTTPDEFLFGKDFQNGRTSRMMKKIKGKLRTKRFRPRR